MSNRESDPTSPDSPEGIPKQAYTPPEITDHGDALRIAQGSTVPWLDVPIEALVDALNDEAKAEELMKRKGWEPKDLMARAELITKKLASVGSTSLSVV